MEIAGKLSNSPEHRLNRFETVKVTLSDSPGGPGELKNKLPVHSQALVMGSTGVPN